MLNFAEQTGSGAVNVVWSFLAISGTNERYKAVTIVQRGVEKRVLWRCKLGEERGRRKVERDEEDRESI